MKLDVKALRFLGRDEMRVLTAVEMGSRNHEFVPASLIVSLSRLKRGGVTRCIRELHRLKLLFHQSKHYDGYRLTFSGYDFLALRVLARRGTVVSVGNQIGVGKESDVYVAAGEDGAEVILKLQRLGRTSFRQIKNKRDYMGKRMHASWLYMSRLAALKEYAFMRALHKHGFPVPRPIDWNRHCVVMTPVEGVLLSHVTAMAHPGRVYADLMNLIVRLAAYGLIHGDFNEFNLMIHEETYEITLIDFPQMVSTTHADAKEYFERDVNCVRTWFAKRYRFESAEYPRFEDVVRDGRVHDLDVDTAASGFTTEVARELDEMVEALGESLGDGMSLSTAHDDEDDGDGDGDDDDDEEAELDDAVLEEAFRAAEAEHGLSEDEDSGDDDDASEEEDSDGGDEGEDGDEEAESDQGRRDEGDHELGRMDPSALNATVPEGTQRWQTFGDKDSAEPSDPDVTVDARDHTRRRRRRGNKTPSEDEIARRVRSGFKKRRAPRGNKANRSKVSGKARDAKEAIREFR